MTRQASCILNRSFDSENVVHLVALLVKIKRHFLKSVQSELEQSSKVLEKVVLIVELVH